MTTFLQFALAGLGFGAIYALVALGIVVIHRGSGVVNFAQGAIGMVGTYLFYQFHSEDGWAFAPAFVACVLICAGIGVAIQVLVMHPMRNSSPLTRLLATLGILTTFESVITLAYPNSLINLTSSLPTGFTTVFGARVGDDRLWILALTVVLTVGLALIYRLTSFGRATTAVSENPRTAATLGYSPSRVAAYNWALGSALAGVAGILVAPITGITVTSLTLLVIPALSAAVIGGMRSFPITVIAALVIGVLESETTNYISTPGWPEAVPFVVVLIYLTIRGRTIPDRAHMRTVLPKVGSGRIRPGIVIGAVVVGAVVLQTVPLNWVDGTTTTLITAILLLSITVVTGYGGQLSLAQYAMAGLGAYVAGRLSDTQHWPFIVTLVIGVVAALPIGIVVGLPALRTRSWNLAIVTLGLSVAIEAVIFDSSSLTGGQLGTQIRTPSLFGINLDPTLHPRAYGTAVLVLFLIAGLAVANLRRSATGRKLLSVRSNERAAAALGVGIVSSKLYAFSIGSMVAALGGILLAFKAPFIQYSNFGSLTSVNLVGDSAIGGLGHVGGSIPGSLFQPGSLTSNVIGLFGDSLQTYLLLVSGVVLILTLVAAPHGSAAQVVDAYRALERKVLPRRAVRARNPLAGVADDTAPGVSGEAPSVLQTRGLSVRFGNTHALRDVDMRIASGEVVGLIGPNGAGKTTFIDAVTGFVRPSSGTVELDDSDVTRSSATERARRGVARSFQSLELFEDMTVLENIFVASDRTRRVDAIRDLIWPRKAAVTPAARAAIREFQIEDTLTELPIELSYGRRRLVAIARAIAASPRILMLDEPAAGLDDRERVELSSLIRRLANEWGIGVLLIEHDVDLVMRTCDHVYVLEYGALIAHGTPTEVRQDPRVIESYLGGNSAEDAPEAAVPDDGSLVAPAQ